jgi:hypothetical protein
VSAGAGADVGAAASVGGDDAVDPVDAGHADTSGLRATASDVARFHRTIVARAAMTFAAMILCHAGYLPVWGLVLANVVLYPEVYLRVHDIGHGTAISRFGWAARFVPTSNPIWGGTRVFAVVHREHHQHLGTDRDPWLPYYTGHPLRALFFNFIEPETSFRSFVRLRGWDRELLSNVAYNLVCLGVSFFVFQWTYVLHIFIQRCVHCVGIFFFNFYTHRETLTARAPIGTWERAEELRAVLPLLRLVWGRDTIDGLIYHNRHHCLGQQHLPVQSYKSLVDTGVFNRAIEKWPIPAVVRTTAASAEPDRA